MATFNLKHAQHGDDKAESALFASLDAKPGPKGTLYRCRECESAWFGPDRYGLVVRLSDADEVLVADWQLRPLLPTHQEKEVLRQIGGTELDGQRIRFPCRVRLHNSEIIDPAFVLMTTDAPISREERSPILLSDVVEFAPSDFALPRDVRRATAHAEEVRMCFYPTLVESPRGGVFILGLWDDIFVHQDVKASEIRLVSERRRAAMSHPLNERELLADRFTRPEAYVYCDWFPEAASYLVR